MANCVANPIYDTAFKFLMEDDRCAKILLSALLKKDVVDVKVRPHEYSKKEEKRVSIYRVDFCATIREADGSEHLVLVELQKTWRPTELLRFRKYLGMQYEDKRNVSDETGIPLPVVSIYILGHKVGDLKEPVVYVKRQYLDYDSQEIKDGVPSVFVESLTHDSIIVQVPYLKGNVRNHLERLLEIFNQDFVSDESNRLVYIEGRDFSDPDAQRLITRLAFAAADPEIHYAMNVEEEILGELEGLDTKVQVANEKLVAVKEKLAEQSTQLAEQSTQLAEQSTQLAEQSTQLAEQSTQIAEQSTQIAEQSTQLAEQSTQLAEQSTQIAEQSTQLAEQSTQLAEQSTQLAEQSNIILATAKALKQSGMSTEQIIALTKLSAEDIAEL